MKEGTPSATARVIAAAAVLCSYDSEARALMSPGAAEWSARFLSTRRADRLLLASIRSPALRRLWALVERLTLPGITRHYLLRKRWLEAAWRRSAAEGFGQLVVLGAGLDTLAARVAGENPGVRAVEVDHPATQGLKRRTLGPEHGVGLVECRLGEEPVSAALLASAEAPNGFDPSRATVVIAEGVLMYLTPAAIGSLTTDLAGLPVPRMRLLATVMDSRSGAPAFRPRSRLVDLWLRVRGEPFRSGIDPAKAASLLEGYGWGLRQCLDVAATDGAPIRSEPLMGELLIWAERDGA